MTTADRILQKWRYQIVEPYIPSGCKILDIGGFDGSFLARIQDRIGEGVCIDPLIEEKSEGKLSFIKSRVVDKLPFPDLSFDVVTMLAVYEHLGSSRELVTREVFRVLKSRGLALLTVPSSAVDYILKVLVGVRLVDGMSLEEHAHFRSSKTREVFEECGFTLKQWSRFQLGLNNLFIFER
jgi:ubiquinone/menaquinone biosynthesis C-methylase UbiE